MSTTEDRADALTVYEVGYLLLPSLSEEAVATAVTSITKAIESVGEKFDGEEPFMFDLAYSMSKVVGSRKYVVNEAWIGWMKFEAEPSRIEEVKAALEKMEEVLRFLIVKAPRETTFTFAEAFAKKREAQEPQETEAPAEAAEEKAPEAPAPEADAVVAPTLED